MAKGESLTNGAPPYHHAHGEPIPQPSIDSGMPQYSNMSEVFASAFDLPDDIVFQKMSENTPPVGKA